MDRRSTLTRTFLALLALAAFSAPTALAEGGGAGVGDAPSKPAAGSGGGAVGGKQRRPTRRTPVLAAYRLGGTTLSDGGAIALHYRVTAAAKKVRVRGVVRTLGGRYVKTLELGVHRTNVKQSTQLTQRELGVASAGRYRLRLTARDGAGRAAKRARKVPAWIGFAYTDHRFPVNGPFGFGGDGAKFGAGRPGHTHQGQDVVADSGEPIVAPYSGTISYVAYQAAAAGYYVVEHADDGRDYVFMHLLKGSTAVKQGQRVATGDAIGKVGATGDASGPHLHFEVWVDGAWQFGGHPVDPLPLLKSWYASGAGSAVRTSSAAAAAAVGSGHFD